MIRITCPRCRSGFSLPLRKAGKKIACPKCSQKLRIPSGKKRANPNKYEDVPVALAASSNAPGVSSGEGRMKSIGIGIVLIVLIACGLVIGYNQRPSAKPQPEKAPTKSKNEPKVAEIKQKTPQEEQPSSLPGETVAEDSAAKDGPSPKPQQKSKTTKPEPEQNSETSQKPPRRKRFQPQIPPIKLDQPNAKTAKPIPQPTTKPAPPVPLKVVAKISDSAVGMRTKLEIRQTLAAINQMPEIADPVAAEQEAALRRLKSYRYLVGIPFKDLVLADTLNEYALAAAKICKKLGKLSHNPPNPGWPIEEYKKAKFAAGKSNLYATSNRSATLVQSVDAYMADSDRFNIKLLGHRRWCLNPLMLKTGFGKEGGFFAMMAHDRSRKNTPDFDYVSYPAPGYMPVDYFKPNYAWSVSLNPKKFQPPATNVIPKIYPVDEKGTPAELPIKLNFQTVNRMGFGIPYCLVYRPEPEAVMPGKKYQVLIEGLITRTNQPVTIQFQVEFFKL